MRFKYYILAVFITILPASLFATESALEKKVQADANKINKEIQPIEKDVHLAQDKLNELYSLEDPTFYIYKKPSSTLSFSPYFDYRKKSADRFSFATLVENRLTQQRYFAQQSVNDAVPNGIEEFDLGFDSFLRTEFPTKPTFHIGYYRTFAEKSFLGNNGNSFKGDFVTYLFGVSNEIDLAKDVSLNTELTYDYKVNRATDGATNADAFNERAHEVSITPELDFKHEWGVFSILTGFSTAKIITAKDLLDHSNSQSLGFRWAITDYPSVYRQLKQMKGIQKRLLETRSTTYEVGIHRSEREFVGTANQENYQPYVSAEWNGLGEGYWDLAAGYQILFQKQTNRFSSITPQGISIVPGYVPYHIQHQNSFLPKIELVKISSPNRLAFSDGDNDHWTTGLQVEAAVTAANSVTVTPSINLEYTRYYKLAKHEFGIHFNLAF